MNPSGLDGQTDITHLVSELKPLAENDHIEQLMVQGHHDIVPFVSNANVLLGFITKEQILQRTIRHYKELSEQDRKLLESSYNGIMAIDIDGKNSIVQTRPQSEFWADRRRKSLGKHISFLDPSMGLMGILDNPRDGQWYTCHNQRQEYSFQPQSLDV